MRKVKRTEACSRLEWKYFYFYAHFFSLSVTTKAAAKSSASSFKLIRVAVSVCPDRKNWAQSRPAGYTRTERIVMPLGLSVTGTFAWAAIIDQSRKMRTGSKQRKDRIQNLVTYKAVNHGPGRACQNAFHIYLSFE